MEKNKLNELEQMGIPLIDVSNLFGDDYLMKKKLAVEIIQAVHHIGFFSIVGHGISKQLIDSVFKQSNLFFGQASHEKFKVSNQHTSSMQGYFGFYEETPENSMDGDYKEGFDIGNDEVLSAGTARLYGLNQWPEGVSEFRSVMVAYYQEMLLLSKRILGLFAIGLNQEEHFFDQFLNQPLAQLRLLHYPGDKEGRRAQVGCGVMTQCNDPENSCT